MHGDERPIWWPYLEINRRQLTFPLFRYSASVLRENTWQELLRSNLAKSVDILPMSSHASGNTFLNCLQEDITSGRVRVGGVRISISNSVAARSGSGHSSTADSVAVPATEAGPPADRRPEEPIGGSRQDRITYYRVRQALDTIFWTLEICHQCLNVTMDDAGKFDMTNECFFEFCAEATFWRELADSNWEVLRLILSFALRLRFGENWLIRIERFCSLFWVLRWGCASEMFCFGGGSKNVFVRIQIRVWKSNLEKLICERRMKNGWFRFWYSWACGTGNSWKLRFLRGCQKSKRQLTGWRILS